MKDIVKATSSGYRHIQRERERERERDIHTRTHPLVVFGVFGNHVSEQAYPIVDTGAILLLNQVVHLSLVWFTDIAISVVIIKAAKRRDGSGWRGRFELGRGRGGGHRSKLRLPCAGIYTQDKIYE